MLKIITDQSGKKGFMVQGTCITNPYYDETMRSEVEPIQYYGLTKDQLIHFEHLKPKPKFTTDELINHLQGMKFFIVRWSGDACNHKNLFDDSCSCHTSHKVDNPLTFFKQYFYGDDVLNDLSQLEVGQKYQVDEMMQDIEIMRVE